jgi:hypothetical protein
VVAAQVKVFAFAVRVYRPSVNIYDLPLFVLGKEQYAVPKFRDDAVLAGFSTWFSGFIGPMGSLRFARLLAFSMASCFEQFSFNWINSIASPALPQPKQLKVLVLV